ncbi:hypothetical protein LOD99_8502 [Oopsacas minuta]|uniref:Uncharacterized protein n=1 Tax=Oopsacas minuta TaxID=111878 RepID=A0AAV7JG51_9METZ|nr:hypothetical protein LOD99_8502 [Oopsacas minuta]
MHRPELQETLSQFMCHSRSTTEKHYRTHMAHRRMYTIFKELGRCQAIEGHVADFVTTPHETPTNLPDSNIETEIDDVIEVNISANTDASDIESVSPLAVDLIDELQYQEELSHPKFHSKCKAKSFLCDQTEEDTFFRVFGSMITDSIALRLVCTRDVCRLAQNSEFKTIWGRLVEHYGYAAAKKEQAMEVWWEQGKVEWEQLRDLEKQRHMRELNSRFEREEDNKERLEEWNRKFKEVLMWEERLRRCAADDIEKSDRYENIIFDWQVWDEDGRRGSPQSSI